MIFQFFCDREPLKTIHYAETPKTFNTCPQDPAWTLSALSAGDSGSSNEEEHSVVSPEDAEVLHDYNKAMSELAKSLLQTTSPP